MKNYLPIRKLVAGLLAAVLVAVARQAGVTLGSDDADMYVNDFIGFVVAYLVPDPRVKKVVDRVGLRAKLGALNRLLIAAVKDEQAPPQVLLPKEPLVYTHLDGTATTLPAPGGPTTGKEA